MKKIALLAFTAFLSGTALMAQDTSLNKPVTPTYDTTALPNSNNSWNKDKEKNDNNWNKEKDKIKKKKKSNMPDSSGAPAARPDSTRRER